MDAIFGIAILILSVVAHEVSHGYAADALGDPTARLAGRLTPNPLKHLDLVGSILVPLVTWFSGGFIFGWAKPVPYNPYNVRKGKLGEALIALAGPAANIAIALVGGMLIRFLPPLGTPATVLAGVVLINLVLAVFNLVPIPPLDGSKILFALLPYRYDHIRMFLERYGLILVLLFIVFLWSALFPIVSWLFSLITGLS